MAALPASVPSAAPASDLVLRATVSAYLGRYRGQTRMHTESDLRVFLRWCADQDLDPLAAARADIERYVRWLQDVRRYQPSTVSRRLSVVVGFYRVCVIDQILPHSPADYVRRPTVPPESPTLGLGHLQFEALITTARLSTNPNDFALDRDARPARATDLRSLRRQHQRPRRGTRPPGAARPRQGRQGRPGPAAAGSGPSDRPRRRRPRPTGRSCATPSASGWTGTPPPAGSSTWPPPPGIRMPRMHPHMLRHTFVTTMLDAGVSLRDVQIAARHADPRTTMRYDRARKNLDRHPNYILAAYMASGN